MTKRIGLKVFQNMGNSIKFFYKTQELKVAFGIYKFISYQ
jgi:hypothetical protein